VQAAGSKGDPAWKNPATKFSVNHQEAFLLLPTISISFTTLSVFFLFDLLVSEPVEQGLRTVVVFSPDIL
jgi:hypothetical protein